MNRFGMLTAYVLSMFLPWSLAGCAGAGYVSPPAPAPRALAGPTLWSLSELSIETLRHRRYESEIQIVEPLTQPCTAGEVSGEYKTDALRYMGAYLSEGQRVYTRIDIPSSLPPAQGFPVIVFAHGWVGAEGAADWHFGCSVESIYADMIAAWVSAGYVVLAPGYRGHGTVQGVQAEGIEDVEAWDNGAYLMPTFYAVDVLNLLAGIESIEGNRFDSNREPLSVDLGRVFVNGHSQGGDVALTVLAAVGEGAWSGLRVAGGSIWAGNIADRPAQLATFDPMQSAPNSFLSGDGTWTGSALGQDGSVNPDFIFGYPSDWIETPDPSEWTWQKEKWNRPSVRVALEAKAQDMYETINGRVDDLGDLSWSIETYSNGALHIVHDPRVIASLLAIGGYDAPKYLSEPLNLHHSDHDFYSLPEWNASLCRRVNEAGGQCVYYAYPGNTHSFKLSDNAWFSPEGSVAGYDAIVAHDLARFGSARLDPNQRR
ncbi:alpha/beta hydrolase family protein [Hyphomonas sp.]|uniref:alpha/beta hydrolase family protein n=1 Tax=Hyphomonas sp. TaxID=87 RepID=UPI003569AFC6